MLMERAVIVRIETRSGQHLSGICPRSSLVALDSSTDLGYLPRALETISDARASRIRMFRLRGVLPGRGVDMGKIRIMSWGLVLGSLLLAGCQNTPRRQSKLPGGPTPSPAAGGAPRPLTTGAIPPPGGAPKAPSFSTATHGSKFQGVPTPGPGGPFGAPGMPVGTPGMPAAMVAPPPNPFAPGMIAPGAPNISQPGAPIGAPTAVPVQYTTPGAPSVPPPTFGVPGGIALPPPHINLPVPALPPDPASPGARSPGF